jgi:glycosyltransferase involved in cell wall biosynthesis
MLWGGVVLLLLVDEHSLMETQNKAVCFTLWFSKHNNPRYVDLFPRLDTHVRFHKVTLSYHRILRGVQFRLWRALSPKVIYPHVLRYLGQRYETLFTVDCSQAPLWPSHKSVVVDIDDPVFTPAEVYALNMPQVKAIVVTTEKAKQIFRDLGVNRPIHVVPQGVPVGETDRDKVQEIRRRFRKDTDVIIGYHAPSLTMFSDGSRRARGGQDDLDFLFDVLEGARRIEPRIKLWLFGEPSDAVKKFVLPRRESWATLFGYVPFFEMLNYLANVDIGVYPRTWEPPPARFSVKIAQFMGCGIPVISRNLDESFIVDEARCGVVCDSKQQFFEAIVELAQSSGKRAALGSAGRTYAQTNLDWSVLVPIYKEILKG